MADLKEELQRHHKASFKGIYDVVRERKTLRKFPFVFSAVASFVFIVLIVCFFSDQSYAILKVTAETVFSLFPNLLGFSLGGFAIVVGFSNTDLIKRGSSAQKYSIYQILNAIFATSILFQIIATVFAFFVTWVVKLELHGLVPYYNEIGAVIINSILLLFIIFSASYSLFLTPFLVANLFSLSQVHSMFLTVERINDINKKESEKPSQDSN